MSKRSGKQVQSVSYAPASALAPVVASYWGGIGDLRGRAPHVTELLADPCVHFVFERSSDRTEARLVGVWTRLWKRKLEGVGRVWGVKLRAGALRAFVGASASEFTNHITPLGEVFSRGIPTLQRNVTSTDDDAEAFALIESWLAAVRRPDDPQVRLATMLVDRIARQPAITSVDALATVAGLEPRALQRLFRDYVGASPKWAIRRNRLQEAAVRIERGEGESLADLAALLGYADQAHLARDFSKHRRKEPERVSPDALRGNQI